MFGIIKKESCYGRARKTDWLIAQGYRSSTLPSIVMWYTKDRELKGRTHDYNLNLYRAKGFVLDRKHLDSNLWNEIVYSNIFGN